MSRVFPPRVFVKVMPKEKVLDSGVLMSNGKDIERDHMDRRGEIVDKCG